MPFVLYSVCAAAVGLSLYLADFNFGLPKVRAARPSQDRDFTPGGPTGVLDLIQRLRDTIGTATQIFSRGPLPRLSTVRAMRSGPLSAVYRSTLESSASLRCEPGDPERKCESAINGFGTVGEVQYEFRSSRDGLRGRSTQVLVACRCLSAECNEAVLIRPITIVRETKKGMEDTGKRTCLYEAVGGKFSDCSGELLRVSQRHRSRIHPDYVRKGLNFTYTVKEQSTGDDFWTARGQRGWTRDCTEAEVQKLPTVDLSKLTRDDIQFNTHSTHPTAPHCAGSGNVQYYREEEEEGAACAAVYEFASPPAANLATQQDEIAVAKRQSSYFKAKPALITDTELALSVSAAALGVLFLWAMYHQQLKKINARNPLRYLAWGIFKQLLTYGLEALPLHIALGQEISARNWESLFAFADASITLARDLKDSQGSAEGSVLIVVGVLGEVKYLKTREAVIAGLTALFDSVAFGMIGITFIRKWRLIIAEKRQVLYELGVPSDVTSLSEDTASQTTGRLRRRRRRNSKASSRHGRTARGSRSLAFRANDDDVKNVKKKISLSSLSSCNSPSRGGSAFSNAEWEEVLAAESKAAAVTAAQRAQMLNAVGQADDPQPAQANSGIQDSRNLIVPESSASVNVGRQLSRSSHERNATAEHDCNRDVVITFESRAN